MAWGKMADMEMDDEDKLDTLMPLPMDRPDYPCGLRICLTARELKKLDLDDNCNVGDTVDLRCFAEVTSISKDGDHVRVELQIQRMAAEDENSETD